MIGKCEHCGLPGECQIISPDNILTCSRCEDEMDMENNRIWALADAAAEAVQRTKEDAE